MTFAPPCTNAAAVAAPSPDAAPVTRAVVLDSSIVLLDRIQLRLDPRASSGAGCQTPLFQPGGDDRQRPRPGRAAYKQADVACVQRPGHRVLGADEVTERCHRWRRRDVVVGAVDVEERGGDVAQFSVAVTQSDAAGRQAVFPAETSDHVDRSEEHTSELQSRVDLVCRLLLEKKKI